MNVSGIKYNHNSVGRNRWGVTLSGHDHAQAAVPGIWRTSMLWTITVVLLVLWLVGLVSGTTLGGWIHILIVLAIISLIFNLIAGRRA